MDEGKDGYPYDVRDTSKLQAQIMKDLQEKIGGDLIDKYAEKTKGPEGQIDPA